MMSREVTFGLRPEAGKGASWELGDTELQAGKAWAAAPRQEGPGHAEPL